MNDMTRRYLAASREGHAEAVRLAARVAELEALVNDLATKNANLRKYIEDRLSE